MEETDALVDALARTAFDTTAALTRLAAEFDLTLAQLRVLGILRGRRVRMTELAAYLQLQTSSLSGLVERAEGRGLVARERSALDGRAVEVFLTPHGVRVAGQVSRRGRELVGLVTGGLTARETRQLRALLEKTLRSRDPTG